MLLHHLDTLIGIVVILLGVSLLVMILTQLIAALLNLRGNDLKDGLKVLLENLDPQGRLVREAELIAEKALTHPLIAHSMNDTSGWWRRASAIRKEELVEILKILKNSPEAAQAVVKIEMAARDLEAYLDTWFNKTMDRVSERFKVHTRVCTVILSLILAFALQLDVLILYEQISTDAELRASLVAQAESMEQRAAEVLDSNAPQDVQPLIEHAQKIQEDLQKTNFTLVPKQALFSKNSGYWSSTDADGGPVLDALGKPISPIRHWLGTLAMCALLSLGSPFWFNILNKLTNLRTVLASKVKEEHEGPQNP